MFQGAFTNATTAHTAQSSQLTNQHRGQTLLPVVWCIAACGLYETIAKRSPVHTHSTHNITLHYTILMLAVRMPTSHAHHSTARKHVQTTGCNAHLHAAGGCDVTAGQLQLALKAQEAARKEA